MWAKTDSKNFKQIMWLPSGRFIYTEDILSGHRLVEHHAENILAVASPKNIDSVDCDPNLEPEKFDIIIKKPELKIGDMVEFKCGTIGVVLNINNTLWVLNKDIGWCHLRNAWDKDHAHSIVKVYRPSEPVGFQLFGNTNYGEIIYDNKIASRCKVPL